MLSVDGETAAALAVACDKAWRDSSSGLHWHITRCKYDAAAGRCTAGDSFVCEPDAFFRPIADAARNGQLAAVSMLNGRFALSKADVGVQLQGGHARAPTPPPCSLTQLAAPRMSKARAYQCTCASDPIASCGR